MGGRVRDVAPPQMCQSQSHHVTVGVTIGISLREEGPERGTGARHTGSTLHTRQLQSWWEEGATRQLQVARETGPVTGPDRGEWDTQAQGRSVHTHRDS